VEISTCPGGPTGEEVAAVALGKLGEGDVFFDVGCGTGFVSVLASERFGRVFAVDSRNVAVETARENFDAFGVTGEVVQVEAPGALAALPVPDAAFVGGSRNLERVLDFLDCSVVVSCARLGTVERATEGLEQSGRLEEVLQVQVSRGYDLEGSTAFRGDNPVFLVVGGPC